MIEKFMELLGRILVGKVYEDGFVEKNLNKENRKKIRYNFMSVYPDVQTKIDIESKMMNKQ